MGKKITQYPNNVSTNPDNLSLLDLSEKTGASTFESRKWNLTAFKAWVNSWVVAGAVAWNDITGKPTTLSGYGITDAIDGNGTNNYVAKFTPDGNTIGNSKIIDDGNRIGVNTVPNSDTQFNVFASAVSLIAVGGVNQGTGALSIGGQFGVSGASSYNIGVKGYSLNSPVKNIGVEAVAEGTSTGETIGVYSRAENSSVSNIAGFFVSSGTGSKYSLQLKDGTQEQGKFLKSVTSDGKANWANITASDVQGAVGAVNGTNNYVAKFTPDGNTIGNSQIQDNGTSVGVNIAPNSMALFKTYTASMQYGLYVENGKTAGVVYSAGFYTNGINSSGTNIGLDIGVTGGLTNYSLKLQDGTQGAGKFLKDVSGDGKANWSYLPTEIQLAVSDETTALTAGTGKITFRMPYAMTVTEVRASLAVAGTTSGLTTIDINEGGASILSTKLTIDLTEKTSTTATTPAVISDTALADDAEITVDIDAISGGATEKGLKILLKGYRTS